MNLTAELKELTQAYDKLAIGMLGSLAGEGEKDVTEPNRVEQLALIVMNRLESDIQAGKAKFEHINPLIRPVLRGSLERALLKRLVSGKQKCQVQRFLGFLKELEADDGFEE